MADWVKIGGIAAVVSAVVAVGGALASGVVSLGGGAESRTPAAVATQQVVQPTSKAPEVPAGEADCLDPTGSAIACADSAAGLAVSAEPCDSDAALRWLGVDTGLRQVAVEAKDVDGQCLLTPGDSARAAGATAADIRVLSNGESVPSLTLCFATESGPEVPCSSPHRIEYVGQWLPDDGGSSAQQACDAAARRYANRTFESPTEELGVVVLRTSDSYRCGISAPKSLDSSLWQIAGAAIDYD